MSGVDARGRSSALPSPAAPPRSSLAGWAEGVAGGSGNPARVPGGSPSLCCKAGPGVRPPPTSSPPRPSSPSQPASRRRRPCCAIGPALGEARLELPLCCPAPHLHRLPVVPSSHGQPITVRGEPVSVRVPERMGASIHESCQPSRRMLTAYRRCRFPASGGPVGASVLAGVLGAGLCDALLTSSHGGGAGVSPSPWGSTARSPSWPPSRHSSP